MAKRRKLQAPSAAELSQIEEEFRRETAQGETRRSAAPIAQVAAETAEALDFASREDRLARARDKEDAEALRVAQAKGLVLLDIPLDEIQDTAIVRDRTALDPDAMEELVQSIASSGMRLPLEVFEIRGGQGGDSLKYGLLSGYRRVQALRKLHGQNPEAGFGTARAILRKPDTDGDRFAAMVEENEVRQQLSQYERGRIASIAARQGVYASTEAAVDALFPVASKAKRSKIRSFARIFEELGDVLRFPEALREKDGLKIAGALREGAGAPLREALAASDAQGAGEELEALSGALSAAGAISAPSVSRGGRPKRESMQAKWSQNPVVKLNNGIELRRASDAQGFMVHMSGAGLSSEKLEAVFEHISEWLERND